MPNISVCEGADLVVDVARKLIERQIDGLPVVKKTSNGLEVTGRMTKTNVTKAFKELVEGI